MKLFLHAHVKLEYVNFRREIEFKRFGLVSTSTASISDNCCQATAEENEINPHLNRHDHSFKDLLDL